MEVVEMLPDEDVKKFVGVNKPERPCSTPRGPLPSEP